MALSIGVQVGSRIDVGGHLLEVRALAHPNLIIIGVDGGEDVVISEEVSKEILPQVKVFTGIGATGTGNRLAFRAPREIRISRIEPSKPEAEGSVRISEKIRRVLRAEAISDTELEYMLSQAAITSIRDCNRRYYSWLFRVENDVLLDMQRADLVEVGHGSSRMMEEHDACNGNGCRQCGWVGQIVRCITDSSARVSHR